MALLLGIESSCDETAVAIVEDGKKVLANAVSSQMAKHAPYGGVVPELAAREHLTAIEKVCAEALSTSGVSMNDIAAVAVTHAPGLVPALLVGLNFAKGLAVANGKPLIGINHFLAHIYGAFVDSETAVFEDASLYPMVALVVSGGHTSIVVIRSGGKADIVGTTIDDAAGEALDKGAKLLNLGYPGGPVIEKLAAGGNRHRFNFPRSLTGTAGKAVSDENRFNFSFSGLKTALLYHANGLAPDGSAAHLEGELLTDTLASYQEAVVDVLCTKAFDAAEYFHARTALLCGGVACNSSLRERFEKTVPKGIRPILAPRKYCTDNAAMVAGLAYHYFAAGKFSDLSLDTFARLPKVTEVPFRGRSS
ncbi:MAG: tRNA N6-adenosine threonylcarbamoyltransferase [Lentisphaerae bacterium ADurb.Bin242]|nr:MAG: tRNA N6-adenosine threonylcarbamoyltransferase [Lentisphaerae bacterium ADurb.Bin242]